MNVPDRIYELWRQYGWNVEPDPRLQYRESWCHGFEGPVPAELEPEIKAEKGEER